MLEFGHLTKDQRKFLKEALGNTIFQGLCDAKINEAKEQLANLQFNGVAPELFYLNYGIIRENLRLWQTLRAWSATLVKEV